MPWYKYIDLAVEKQMANLALDFPGFWKDLHLFSDPTASSLYQCWGLIGLDKYVKSFNLLKRMQLNLLENLCDAKTCISQA